MCILIIPEPGTPFCESERDIVWQILWPTTVGDSTATAPCGDGIIHVSLATLYLSTTNWQVLHIVTAS